eukprot:3137932-Amphidinium_carterae.1
MLRPLSPPGQGMETSMGERTSHLGVQVLHLPTPLKPLSPPSLGMETSWGRRSSLEAHTMPQCCHPACVYENGCENGMSLLHDVQSVPRRVCDVLVASLRWHVQCVMCRVHKPLQKDY